MQSDTNILSSLKPNRVPYAAVKWYRSELDKGREIQFEEVSDVVRLRLYESFQNITFFVGIVLIVFYLQYGLSALARYFAGNGLAGLLDFLKTSSERAEARLKLSGSRKINALLENAYQLHPHVASAKGSVGKLRAERFATSSIEADDPTMRNFVLRGERFEHCGGVLWTWLNLLNGTLFSSEGIWINTRLIVMQVAQVIVAFIMSISLILVVEEIADEAGKAREDLNPSTPHWAADVVPTRQMVYRSLYPAALTATAVMILLIGVSIPRYVR